jgi:perosamine synthetase
LKDVPGIILPIEKDWCENSYWMYGILIDKEEFGMSRDELQKRLEEKGIETRIFFRCMHNQPIYERMGVFEEKAKIEIKTIWDAIACKLVNNLSKDKINYPVAETLETCGLYLPSSTKLTEDEIKHVCECIQEVAA